MPTTPTNPPIPQHPTRFRLKFDVPYSFAVESGYYRAQHANDFRIPAGGADGCMKDPLTGLVMLTPSHLTTDFYASSNWVPITQWDRDTSMGDPWTAVHRSVDPDVTAVEPLYWSFVPVSTDGLMTGFSGTVNALVSVASILATDYMVWAGKTTFNLARDEAFVWNYQSMTDEMNRRSNWFALQWGGIYLHFSPQGHVRCYLYGDDPTEVPTLFDEFDIASPGEILNQAGYFVFLPIPTFGLAVYHSKSAQRIDSKTSSAFSGSVRGHLIRLPEQEDPLSGGKYVLGESTLSLAMGVNLFAIGHVFGMHRITYPASGTVAAEIFDPGYKPTEAPSEVAPSPLPSPEWVVGTVGITTALKSTDLSRNWTPGTDRQGRVLATLTTSDSKHTPFLGAVSTRWNPVFANRNTTPVTLRNYNQNTLPDRLWRLEFSDDDMGRFEGMATVMVTGAAMRAITERGDATFQLEKSFDDGATWSVHAGGLARVKGDVSIHITQAGQHYIANWELADMFTRFGEVNQFQQGAFDGQSLGDGINLVLGACGCSPLVSIPAELASITLPPIPPGQNFRYAPNVGDSGDEIIRDLLLLARGQYHEYRLRHDWANDDWIVELRPRLTTTANTWELTPFYDEVTGGFGGANTTTRKIRIGEPSGDGPQVGTFTPMPPEANLIQPFGLSSPDPNTGARVPGTPIKNFPSLNTPTSRDYLGRIVMAFPFFAVTDNVKDINDMGRRVYDAACHQRFEMAIPSFVYADAFKPLCRAYLRGLDVTGNRINLYPELYTDPYTGLWVKRRIVQIDYHSRAEDIPLVTYHLDSIWESKIK